MLLRAAHALGKLLKLVCLCGLIATGGYAPAQATIGGIVNLYTPVTAIGCSQLNVASAAGFAAGDRVLIIQMKGAGIDTSNTSQFGDIIHYNNSGNYEFATIASVSGNVINLNYSLVNAYTVPGLVQLVRVPQYASATVSSALSCAAWNGSTGGVLALEASGILTLNADVDVSGKGFRGGTQCANPDGGCGSGYSDYYYAVSSGFGAEKGEGITIVPLSKNGGRGSPGNGGGGGNKHNSGGGGGGNYSAGGHGGNEADFCPPTAVGGDGGKGLDYTTQHKIFMGGGGGCSDNNNGVGTFGTNGGGIIIIRAAGIQAGGASAIRSNGIDQVTIPNGIGDGAGGGGAGGAILLDVPGMTGAINIEAKGGAGGGQNCTYGSCFGPGGGGGAGFIGISALALPPGTSTNLAAGLAGVDIYPGSPCYNTSYGATGGQAAAAIQTNYVFVEGQSAGSGTVSAGSSKIICVGDSVMIGLPPVAGLMYSWAPPASLSSFSVSNPTAFPAYTTTYTLTVTSVSGGCSGSAGVLVSVVSCDTLSSISIPNVFTPNGDGVNDLFKVSASGLSIHCSIYSRWGQKLYEWNGADGAWNGQELHGREAPDGTYYYILEASGYKVHKTYRGYLTLAR